MPPRHGFARRNAAAENFAGLKRRALERSPGRYRGAPPSSASRAKPRGPRRSGLPQRSKAKAGGQEDQAFWAIWAPSPTRPRHPGSATSQAHAMPCRVAFGSFGLAVRPEERRGEAAGLMPSLLARRGAASGLALP